MGVEDYARYLSIPLIEDNLPREDWIAATIPTWTTPHHQSRYLTNSGHLFFQSLDALVTQDINGTEDVYEFEPEGTESCKAASATFSPASGGCVGLISSGTSPTESAFVDASESGGDVFFLTTEKLVPEDTETGLAIFDAHDCATGWACVAPPVSTLPCTTADSCRAAPSPEPAIFGAPASATFSGFGNVNPGVSVTPVKPGPKSLTRAQKLARALAACRRARRSQRAACKRQARKRYGAKSRKSTARRGGAR